MKRILMSVLLSAAMFFNVQSFAMPANVKARIVDCYLENYTLFATSSGRSGTITKVDIYDSGNNLVAEEFCSSTRCAVDVSGLPAGTYTAVVTTTVHSYSEGFTL